MKNFKHFFKTMLMTVVLCSAGTGFAQTAAIPAGCTVVIAGTGGTVGTSTSIPPGRVGDGGVVAMPDPSGGGTFTFAPTGGATTATWSLKGDLSNSTVSPNYGAPTQPAAGLSANIITYNKFLRTSSTETSNPTYGRSKGQVKISWSEGTCGRTITFDVYKSFTNALPAIVGPTCLKPNTQYTYSVDRIVSDNTPDNIGFDSYYWSGIPAAYLTPAAGFYNSADGSSITFTTGAIVSPFTLQCCYGRVNPTSLNVDGGPSYYQTSVTGSHTSCVTQPLILEPTAPTYVTAPPTCHPTGTASFNIVYPNVILPLTYTWTAPNTGWTIGTPVIGASTTTVTVTTPNNNPGVLILTIGGTTCTTTPVNYQVNRTLVGSSLIIPVPTSITPTATGSNCMLAGTNGGTNQFFMGTSASGNNTTWTLTSNPTGATGVTLASVTGQPNSTVAVNIANNATINTTYTLTATANTTPNPACTSVTPATYTFNVKPLTPTITAASGSTNCVVKGALTPQTYTCTASTGANYNWTFPAGWTAPGNNFTTSTNTITVTPANNTAVLNGNATVTATGVGTCNSTISANYAINYQAVAPTFAATPATTCFSVGATTASITLTNAQNFGSYTVTSSPAGITSSGVVTSGNLALTIPPSLASGTYSLTVTHTSSCGNPAATTVTNLTLGGSAASWALNYPSYDNTVGGSDVYRVTVPTGGATYQWYTGATVFTTISALTLIPSPGTNPNASFSPSGNQMTLYGATALTNPQVYCVVTPTTGCASIISAPRGTHGTARPTNNGIKNEKIVIYPNPNDGNFSILLDKVKTTATATLTDMTGKKLGTYTLSKGENKISNKNLASGTYMIIIEVDGEKESQQVIIK